MDLEPLDPSFVVERLSKPPFVIVDGVYNVRDLGLSSVMNDTSIATAEVVSPPMRPGFIYRSGEVSAITEQGAYHCKLTILFLRSQLQPCREDAAPRHGCQEDIRHALRP